MLTLWFVVFFRVLLPQFFPQPAGICLIFGDGHIFFEVASIFCVSFSFKLYLTELVAFFVLRFVALFACCFMGHQTFSSK